jgi:hypothetical protein
MQTRPQSLPRDATAATGAASLEASDDALDVLDIGAPRYCPPQLLADFALLMAGHGRCVNAAMMLGDAEYALWQIACARAMDDAELVALATRLFGYFDDPHRPSRAILGTA